MLGVATGGGDSISLRQIAACHDPLGGSLHSYIHVEAAVEACMSSPQFERLSWWLWFLSFQKRIIRCNDRP